MTPGKSVFSCTHKQKISPRKLAILVLICALVAAGSIFYVLRTGKRINLLHSSLCCAIMEVQLETTGAHLWLEELLGGDEHRDIEYITDNPCQFGAISQIKPTRCNCRRTEA